MFGFYLQWSKVIQYAANSNEENRKPKYLQNFDKRLDMGKHPFILVITIYFIHTEKGVASVQPLEDARQF